MPTCASAAPYHTRKESVSFCFFFFMPGFEYLMGVGGSNRSILCGSRVDSNRLSHWALATTCSLSCVAFSRGTNTCTNTTFGTTHSYGSTPRSQGRLGDKTGTSDRALKFKGFFPSSTPHLCNHRWLRRHRSTAIQGL